MAVRQPVYLAVHQINNLHRPVLSYEQIVFLATKGNWLINAELKQAPIDRELGQGDCHVCAGQGVADLDRVERLMNAYPWGRFSVDVGGPDSYSQFIYIGTNDIGTWRAKYIETWGTVNRPPYWQNDVETIVVGGTQGTQWP
jgi:hypothetical protein